MIKFFKLNVTNYYSLIYFNLLLFHKYYFHQVSLLTNLNFLFFNFEIQYFII